MSLECDRLWLLIQLHEQRTVASAVPLISVLEDQKGELAQPERALAVGLIRQALTANPPLAPGDIETASKICEIIKKKAGQVVWAEVHIAYKEIRLDREYHAGYQRLEREDVIGEPQAKELARASRILAGVPLKPPDIAPGDALSLVDLAMHRLMGRHEWSASLKNGSLWPELANMREDGIFTRLPDLKDVADVLTFSLRSIGGDISGVRRELATYDLPSTAPSWVTWLHGRASLVAGDPSVPGAWMSRIDATLPAVAWSVEAWACNQGRTGPVGHETLEKVSSTLDAWVENQEHDNRKHLAEIRQARAGNYRRFEEACEPSPALRGFSELGSLPASVCVDEIKLEMEYAVARCSLPKGSAAEAMRRLAGIGEKFERMSPVTSALWGPFIHYWLGVAQAHCGEQDATRTLESLVGGSKELEARGQLALLAIKQGRLDEAAQWLDQTTEEVPGLRYARALLHARCGEFAQARGLLQSADAEGLFKDSPYAVAARRLLASVEERSGSPDASERLYQEILEAHPEDEIVTVRLGRRLLRRAYHQLKTNQPVDEDGSGNLLKNTVGRRVRSIVWWDPYRLLYQLAFFADDPPDVIRARIAKLRQTPERAFPWLQILARRLQAGKKVNEAWQVVDGGDLPRGPQWYERSRLILRAWHLLADFWQPAEKRSHKTIVAETKRVSGDRGYDGSEEETRQAARIRYSIGGAGFWRKLSDLQKAATAPPN